MTCREFKHCAASMSLGDLSQTQDSPLLSHVENCPACERWMQKQRTLNASLHLLRARTAGLEAGPDVERALLRVFRQGIPAAGLSPATTELAVAGDEPTGVKGLKLKAAHRSTPFALQLSRWFEFGAYTAVAAALAVAIFLSAHLLRHSNDAQPAQAQAAPQQLAPVVRQPDTMATGKAAAATSSLSSPHRLLSRRPQNASTERKVAMNASPATGASADPGQAADELQGDAEDGYTALMLCDPLSCASETQVVRMELPPSPAAVQGAPPQVADVIVGYDGIVRAVRLVN